MKLFLDFFPFLLFFGAYKLADIYTATGVLMAATVLQMGLIYLRERQLQLMNKVTLVLVLGFGALTLGLHDERFIKWKPTVLYCAMGLALAFALWVLRKIFALAAGQPNGAARCGVAPTEPNLGAVLRLHGGVQCLCRPVFQHRGMGQFQALGLHLPADLHRRPGLVHRPARQDDRT